MYVAGYLAKIALPCTSLDLRNGSEAKPLIFLTRKSLSSTQNNENAFVMAFRANVFWVDTFLATYYKDDCSLMNYQESATDSGKSFGHTIGLT